MSKENCITILGLGLANTQISYKNVLLDIAPEEKLGKSNSFTYKGEEFKPNSAEKYNLELRKRYPVRDFTVEELSHQIRTRNMAYIHAGKLLEVTAYLSSVMELANDVNNQLKDIIKNTKSIQKNESLSKEQKNFEIAITSTAAYIDILVEIKARIVDLQYSKYNHNIARTYANLETQVKTMLETSYVPDELAANINMLYDNYPLHKFSNAKAEGISRTTAEIRFTEFSTRLYSAAIKLFIFELMEEFYPYITPRKFLNNPEKETLFVVPDSTYSKFNFLNSGLTREEVIFLEVQDDMDKTVHNFSKFFKEAIKAITCLQERIQEQKNELFELRDEEELEWVLDAYTKRFAKSAAESNIRCLKKLCKNELFREKLTILLYELRPELLVNKLKFRQNPWDKESVPEQTSEDNDRDINTAVFLSKLLLLCFGKTDFSGIKVQFSRVIPIFPDNELPQKSLRRYCTLVEKGELTWSDSEFAKKLKVALEK